MRILVLMIIRLYWLFPKSMRRKCLFKESCSHAVFNETAQGGWRAGLMKLRARMKQCQPGYVLIPINENEMAIQLIDGSILYKEEISIHILTSHINLNED